MAVEWPADYTIKQIMLETFKMASSSQKESDIYGYIALSLLDAEVIRRALRRYGTDDNVLKVIGRGIMQFAVSIENNDPHQCKWYIRALSEMAKIHGQEYADQIDIRSRYK